MIGACGGAATGILGAQMVQRQIVMITGGLGIEVTQLDADWRVLLFSVGLGILAGTAFGLLPAIETTSGSLVMSTRRKLSPFAGRIRPRRMRNVLIGA